MFRFPPDSSHPLFLFRRVVLISSVSSHTPRQVKFIPASVPCLVSAIISLLRTLVGTDKRGSRGWGGKNRRVGTPRVAASAGRDGWPPSFLRTDEDAGQVACAPVCLSVLGEKRKRTRSLFSPWRVASTTFTLVASLPHELSNSICFCLVFVCLSVLATHTVLPGQPAPGTWPSPWWWWSSFS